MSAIMGCPPEILDQIMGDVEAWRYNYFFLPQAPLTPLLRVCKAWTPIAERRLYQTISIGTYFQSVAAAGADRVAHVRKRRLSGIAHELLSTLQLSPRLCALVRRLRLTTEDFQERAQSEEYVRILQLCPNVDSVHLRGYHPDEVRAFVDALRPKSLTSLVVSGLDRSGGQCGPLCTLSELQQVMARWPDLQCVQFYNGALSTSVGPHPAISAPSKACSQLLIIELPSGPELSSGQLRALLTMRPSGVQKLHIRVSDSGDALSALCACLHAWASSLADLRIAFPRSVLDTTPLAAALSQLTSLRRLHVIPIMLPAHALSDLGHLRELFYYARRTGIADLAKVLEDRERLPQLRILNCILPFDGLDLSTPYEQIEKMSSARGMTFTISTSRRIL